MSVSDGVEGEAGSGAEASREGGASRPLSASEGSARVRVCVMYCVRRR